MDEQTKAQTRKSATRRFYLTVAGLLVQSVVIGLVLYAIREFPQMERRTQLSEQSGRLLFEYIRYYMNQGAGIATLIPPTDKAERSAWAAQIETQLCHSASIFVRDGTTIEWISSQPDSLTRSNVEHTLAALDTAAGMPKPVKTIGSTYVWTREFQSKGHDMRMWLAAQGRHGTRWGATYQSEADWLAFFKELGVPYGSPLEFGSPSWMLNNTFALPGSMASRSLTRMRAFLNDSLIFASPRLDASRDSLHWSYSDNERVEFYVGPGDFSYAQTQFLKRIAVILILLPLLLIFPIFRWFRTVRKLTED